MAKFRFVITNNTEEDGDKLQARTHPLDEVRKPTVPVAIQRGTRSTAAVPPRFHRTRLYNNPEDAQRNIMRIPGATSQPTMAKSLL